MNLPTIIEKEAFNKLPESLKPFVMARLEKPVKEITDNELKKNCYDIISLAFIEQNQLSVEPDLIAFQRDSLFTELRTQPLFKGLTLSEVKNAFKTGIRGETGSFFGMCAKTYHQFLKHYADKKERTECMRLYLDALNEPKKSEKPLATKMAETAESYKRALEHYKKTKEMPYTSFAFYDYLVNDLKIEVVSKEDKFKIAKQTETEYTSELKFKKAKGQIRGDQYEDIISSLSSNPTLKNRMKKLALKKYWDDQR